MKYKIYLYEWDMVNGEILICRKDGSEREIGFDVKKVK